MSANKHVSEQYLFGNLQHGNEVTAKKNCNIMLINTLALTHQALQANPTRHW